jgi:hypothetical protein
LALRTLNILQLAGLLGQMVDGTQNANSNSNFQIRTRHKHTYTQREKDALTASSCLLPLAELKIPHMKSTVANKMAGNAK